MSKQPPIVAELGRPETPEETAARKAERSAAYRSSQTFRSLVAALIATLAIVAVVVLAVPRGEPASAPEVDLPAIAADVQATMEQPVLVPELGEDWRVNAAELEGGPTVVWDITLAPAGEKERGFVRVAQAFDADASWAPQVLRGATATDTERIGGRMWDVYRLGDSADNVSYGLGTTAGDDYVLLYGSRSPDSTAALAESLIPQLRAIEEAS